ncbi:hypothetical protein KBD87_02990 [Candidatus Saccharibacteria bacterium]|jgi:adenylate kinase family enzyme|nr:hypothetical protein [Candidatus Saccharibacteria bacterium]
MKLLIIFGPPAVGKATVGNLVEKMTDFTLFHNHMVTDGIMHIFGKDSESESKLSREIRSAIIGEAAATGKNLIFTYVWNFNTPRGKRNIDHYKQLYEQHGGTVQFIELCAPLEERVQRADTKERWQRKYHTADGNEVRALERGRSFISPDPFYYPDIYTRIDAVGTAQETADAIVQLLNEQK